MTECEMYFIAYCFTIRSLVANATIEQIQDYLNSLGDKDWNWADLNTYLTSIKPFNEFNERYLNNEFKVLPNRFIDGRDIYGVENLN